MYKKLTYSELLVKFKNINSMTHFKRYVQSLTHSISTQNDVSKYYEKQYSTWFNDNFNCEVY